MTDEQLPTDAADRYGAELVDIFDGVERERATIGRTLRAENIPEDKRFGLVSEWLQRAQAHYGNQNLDLYRIHVRRAVAMLIAGLLRTGNPTKGEGNDDGE